MVHFSSKSIEWGTPLDFFEKLNEQHKFTLDVCASAKNKKVNNYFDINKNGLNQRWGGHVCWCNPPYGREIINWMRKAYQESLNGVKIVCLVPARTDTKWWHEYAMRGKIEFIKGRLKFEGAKNAAPFPSAIIIFDKNL